MEIFDIAPLHIAEDSSLTNIIIIVFVCIFVCVGIFLLYVLRKKRKKGSHDNLQHLFIRFYKKSFQIDLSHKTPLWIFQNVQKKFKDIIEVLFLKNYSRKKKNMSPTHLKQRLQHLSQKE